MKATDLCPSPHIEAAELEGDTEVTIKGVDFEKVGPEKERKGVVWFEEFDRSMVLNKTNSRRIIDHYGNETDRWVGKKVTLYPSETDFNNQTVPCIRVRQRS